MRQRRLIDPDADRPVYKQIADDLREQIRRGDLKPGERLPGEARLAQLYGHGTNSIRGALEILRTERLIVTEKGRGSRLRVPQERTLVNVPKGSRARCRPATEDERRQLHLGDREPVVELQHSDGNSEVFPAFDVELLFGDERPAEG